MGSRAQPGTYVLEIGPVLDECASEHGLVSHHHQRGRDAVQRHPVDLALPSLPAPIRCGVTRGDDVQVVAMPCRGVTAYRNRVGPDARYVHWQWCIPGDLRADHIFEI